MLIQFIFLIYMAGVSASPFEKKLDTEYCNGNTLLRYAVIHYFVLSNIFINCFGGT